jgi:hypothetical protein
MKQLVWHCSPGGVTGDALEAVLTIQLHSRLIVLVHLHPTNSRVEYLPSCCESLLPIVGLSSLAQHAWQKVYK